MPIGGRRDVGIKTHCWTNKPEIHCVAFFHRILSPFGQFFSRVSFIFFSTTYLLRPPFDFAFWCVAKRVCKRGKFVSKTDEIHRPTFASNFLLLRLMRLLSCVFTHVPNTFINSETRSSVFSLFLSFYAGVCKLFFANSALQLLSGALASFY